VGRARSKARAEFVEWTTPRATMGPIQMGEIMAYLRDTLPADAIICNGAGNYTSWVHRYYRFRRYRTQLAPRSGSMGYSLPAACRPSVTIRGVR
jgi:acetolactate synthase-1/2/3 large subunit